MDARSLVAPGLSGTFIKTPSPHVVEVLATAGIDFGVLDGEHAPFDRRDVDLMALASRACGLPLMMRLPGALPSGILGALDLGIQGLVIPHVDTAADAGRIMQAARYHGGRGYSGGTRHAAYGTMPMAEAIRRGDEIPVIAQIEHPTAIAELEGILATPGLAGILVGRADLALTMGEASPSATRVEEATAHILATAARMGALAGVVVAHAGERKRFEKMGANWFIVGSDHACLRAGAERLMGAG